MIVGRLATGIGVFLVLALVAGCAPKATPTAAPAPPQTPVATPTPGPATATPAPAPVVKPTGRLAIALAFPGVEVLDPTQTTPAGRMYTDVLYDRVVGHKPDGTLSKETGLARDWEISSDFTRYTFKLRPGIKFHNGDEVTSADVKFSLEHVMRPKSLSPYAGSFRAIIDSIDTPDPLTVVIKTKKPYGFMHYDLSGVRGTDGMVLASKYFKEKGEEFFTLNPIGSGPYRFKEKVEGSYITFEALPSHWRVGVPKYQQVIFINVPEETTRIALLKRGEADVISLSPERIKEMKDYSVFTKAGSAGAGLWVNQQWDPKTSLSDIKVREALFLAINWNDIRDFVFEGQAQVMGHSFRYASMAVGYKPLPVYPYDPAKAKQLLAEASPGGVSLSIYAYPRPEIAGLPRMAEAVGSMWTAVGVKVKIVPVDYGAYRAKLVANDLTNSVGAHAVAASPFLHTTLRGTMHSTALLTTVKIPELDKMIETLEAETDIVKYGELQFQIAKYIRDNHLLGGSWEVGPSYASNPKKITRWDLGRNFMELNVEDLFRR